jgi:uncharacterized protein YqeY
MNLVERIDADLKQAMREKDETGKLTLRAAKTALVEARTATDNQPLTEEAAISVLQKLAKRRRDTALEFEKLGSMERAQAELAEVAILERYLPRQLDEVEVEAIVRAVVAQKGVASVRDMGAVMGPVMEQVAGRADGKVVSQIVRRILTATG